MNTKKCFSFFLSLFVSLCLFAGYTHVTFSLSSAISVSENVRYRFLGSDQWIEVKDKSKVSTCIDVTLDNRIVIETCDETKEWNTLCTASIMALPNDSDGASAKWIWKDLSASATGARWNITGGKWNYIPLSETSVTIDSVNIGKLTLFTVQSTVDGEKWVNVAVHGIIPVRYDDNNLSDNKCIECMEHDLEPVAPIEEVSAKEDEKEEETAAPLPSVPDSSPAISNSADIGVEKSSSMKWTLYGGYAKSSRRMINPETSVNESKDGAQVGAQFMFGDKVGVDIALAIENDFFERNSVIENIISIGLVYRDNYSSFFSPYVKASFQGTYLSYQGKKGIYPTASASLGVDFWFSRSFGIYSELNASVVFAKYSDIISDISLKTGYSLGARLRFGE